jgi:acetyl esterase/lipase
VRASVEGLLYGADPVDLLDLYLPATTAPAPVIVFLHGGGWVGGSRTGVAQWLLREVPRGYAVASVDYRLAPAAPFPAPLEDAKTAVRWVKAHAREFHLRADKVFVAGASAGGHLAAMVALTPGLFEPTGLPPELAAQNSRVVAAVSEVGPLDLGALSRQAGTWGPELVAELLGCSEGSTMPAATCADAMALASPVTYVTADAPPMYLAYGSLDGLVPPASNAYELAHRFGQLGLSRSVALDEVSNLGHNLDVEGLNVTRLTAFFDTIRDDSRAPVGTFSRGNRDAL